MVKSLRESKANLSKLVELASQGEDVLITVRGKVKARLTQAAAPNPVEDRAAWLRELQVLRRKWSRPRKKNTLSIEEILTEQREDRF